MTKVGVHTIYMRKSHPDFTQAMQHCYDYGRLKNGLTLLLEPHFSTAQKVAMLTCLMLKVLV